jgi:hypothetical protein
VIGLIKLRDDWLLAAVAISHAMQHYVDVAVDAKGVARSGRTPHRAGWWHRKGSQEPTHGGGAYATSTGFGGRSP